MYFERFSTIYRIKIGSSWFVFNRSVTPAIISNRLFPVLDAIGLAISDKVIGIIFGEYINCDTLEVLGRYYEYPNVEREDQKELNMLKKEFADTLENTYYRVNKALSKELEDQVNLRFTTGFTTGVAMWLRGIADALNNYSKKLDMSEFFKSELSSYTDEIRYRKKRLDGYNVRDNFMNQQIREKIKQKDQLESDYISRRNEIQAKIEKQKDYIEILDKKIKNKEMMIGEYTTEKLREDMQNKAFQYIDYCNSQLGFTLSL